MKNSRAFVAIVSIAFVIAIGAMAGSAASAATPTVGLASAGNFSVLAGEAVTNTGPTTTDRDVGVHPGTSVGGFPPGIVGGTIHAADAVALQAKSDLTSAYLNAAGRSVTANHTQLAGLTLVDGVYNAGGATLRLNGTLTLDGQNDPSSVWIFQATSDLITGSASKVMLINGASACNVFWQVTSSATLGTGSTFVGTIMALTSITVTTNVTVDGRALARNGKVTLDSDRFISTSCRTGSTQATLPGFTVAPGTATPAPAPITTFTPAPVATATPIGTAASSVTPTTAPTTAPTAAPVAAVPTVRPAAVAGTSRLPSTSTDDPLGPLTMLGIALTGIGILLLVRRPLRHL